MADNSGVYKFTEEIQLKILALLWRDRLSFVTYKDTVKAKYFTKSMHIDICRLIFEYWEKYNEPPTLEAMKNEVTELCSKTKKKVKLLDEYIVCLERMANMDLFEVDYLKDKMVSFGKRQALVEAILESAEILENKSEDHYSKIETLVRDALMVGEDDFDGGVDLFENVRERFLSYGKQDVIERIPTGIEALDKSLRGGLGRTEMGVILAPPGRGKTTALISILGEAICRGYTVLHVSLENNEQQILRNYDSRLLKKDYEYINENILMSEFAIDNTQKYRQGKIRVKKYPTKMLTPTKLRQFLDKIRIKDGFIPDVIGIDYGMLMKPSQSYGDKRSDIELVHEELRAIADEYNCALWVPAQGNRAAAFKTIVTMEDFAECFAISNIADVIITLCQSEEEKAEGQLRLYLAKVRDNEGGLLLSGTIDYSKKLIEMSDIFRPGTKEFEEQFTNKYKSHNKKSKPKTLDEEEDCGDDEEWERTKEY